MRKTCAIYVVALQLLGCLELLGVSVGFFCGVLTAVLLGIDLTQPILRLFARNVLQGCREVTGTG